MPHSAGVAPSIFMRLIAEKLSKVWGKQVLVENKPGASGFIAIESMKGAARDGHELLAVANSHMTINPSLYRQLPYDPEKDFVPVAMVLRASFFITVASNGPYPTVAALIAAAKANPGKLTYSSSYVGSPSHLAPRTSSTAPGRRCPTFHTRTSRRCTSRSRTATSTSTIGSALPLIRGGRIKVIALAAKQRVAIAPDVVAPRGTAAEVIRVVNADVNRLMTDPDVIERMNVFGYEPAPATPAEIAELIRLDTKKNAETVRRSGATAD